MKCILETNFRLFILCSLILLIFTLFSKGFGNRGTIYYGDTVNGSSAANELQMQHRHDQGEVFKNQDKVFDGNILKSILKSVFSGSRFVEF